MNLTWQRITARTRHPFQIARPGSSVADDGRTITRILVRLEHDGIIGLGEGVPVAYYRQTAESLESALEQAKAVLAVARVASPDDISRVVDRLMKSLDDQRAAVSAIDLALFDWLGKRANKPVWQLLQIDPSGIPPTSMTLGIDRLDLLPEKLAEAEQFSILKIKMGTERDREVLSLIRRHAPDKRVRLDANCGWSADRLANHFKEMAEFDVELIEQPTQPNCLAALQEARTHATVPLIADEDALRPDDVARLAGAYDGINIKLSKCGGISQALRMVREARERGLSVMLGCMVETTLGVSGAAQIASLCDYVDLDGHLLLSDDPFTGLRLEGDTVRPSKAPGLGVQPARTNAI